MSGVKKHVAGIWIPLGHVQEFFRARELSTATNNRARKQCLRTQPAATGVLVSPVHHESGEQSSSQAECSRPHAGDAGSHGSVRPLVTQSRPCAQHASSSGARWLASHTFDPRNRCRMKVPSFGPFLIRTASTSDRWISSTACQHQATLTDGERFKKGRFTPEEMKLVNELRASGRSWKQIAAKLGRSASVVTFSWRRKQMNEGFSSVRPFENASVRYSEQEVALITQMRTSGRSWKDIAQALPGRRPANLRLQHTRLVRREQWERQQQQNTARPRGRERWTAEETSRLLDLRAQGITEPALSTYFPDRAPRAAVQKLKYLRFKGIEMKATTNPLWTAAEDKTLRDMVSQGKGYQDIGMIIGRSAWSVKERHCERQIRSKWSSEEDAQILGLREQGKTIQETAAVLATRTYAAVRDRLVKLRAIQARKRGDQASPHGQAIQESKHGKISSSE